MQIIGLTGGIGSGKTLVTNILAKRGIPIFYCDLEAKNIMEKDEVKLKVINLCGYNSYNRGDINVSYISRVLFNDKDKLEGINKIIKPFILMSIKKWVKVNNKFPLGFIESAILIESKLNKYCDKILTVICDLEERIKRVRNRNNFNRDYILKIVSNQISDREKLKHTDYVIENNGSISDLEDRVNNIYELIK